MNIWMRLNLMLFALVVVSAIAVVHNNYRVRRLTTQVDNAKVESGRLEARFRELQIEESKWVTAGQVQEKAQSKLGMVLINDSNRGIITAKPGVQK